MLIGADGNITITDPSSNVCDVIASEYYSNSIALVSPIADTVSFAGKRATAFYDIGTYPYTNAPLEGYVDYELPNRNHYYRQRFVCQDVYY